MMDRPMTTEPLVVAPEKQKSASSKSLDEAKRKLLWGIVLCFAFMLAEVVGALEGAVSPTKYPLKNQRV